MRGAGRFAVGVAPAAQTLAELGVADRPFRRAIGRRRALGAREGAHVAEVGGAVGVGDAAPKAALAPYAALTQTALEVVTARHVERALVGAADAVKRAAVFG